MSPLWRDRLHIVLAPTRVILLRFGRGLRPQVVDQAIVNCSAASLPDAAAWVPPLAALQQLLGGRKWRDADVHFILSNHFVRYLMVAWDEKLADAEEQLAMVRYSFAQVYGDLADDWELRWQEGLPPAPCLASGVERGLLAGVRELFTDAGRHLRLGSVRPYLMTAFNRWRHDIDGSGDWFLLAEPGRLCLGWFRGNEWAGLHSQQAGADWERELPQTLERVRLQAGVGGKPARLCVHAPESEERRIAAGSGWSLEVLRLPSLPGLSAGADAAYALAACP